MTHLPVLYKEVLQALSIRVDGVYLDCTFGRGGHSQGILQHLSQGRLLAIDRDITAIESLQAGALQEDSRFSLYHGSFDRLESIVTRLDLQNKIDGVLMDLGVSSPQLDDPLRGFSFMRDGPLDMRMDNSSGLSAAEWLTQVSEQELAHVLIEYGEERFARRIAAAIVQARGVGPLLTTHQLVRVIESAIPFREKHKHPATRSFQAIRIAVNDELMQLQAGLKQAVNVLRPGGRLVVISFQSLEDRIVKRFIRAETGVKSDPGRLPVQQCDLEQGCLLKVGKPIRASASEIRQNPRARSAVLRVAEKR